MPPEVASELWELLQQRNMKGAALHLVSRHADEVLSLCRGMVRDDVVAEDLSQDVFGRAFAALKDFRGEASSRTWILCIARNRCIDYLRRQEREPREEIFLDAEATAPEPLIDDLLTARSQIQLGLDALGETERALVMLRFGHGLEYAELANTFGLTEGAARMRVSRAVSRMRATLGPFGAPRRKHAPAPRMSTPLARRAPSPSAPNPGGFRGGSSSSRSPFASTPSLRLLERLEMLATAVPKWASP